MLPLPITIQFIAFFHNKTKNQQDRTQKRDCTTDFLPSVSSPRDQRTRTTVFYVVYGTQNTVYGTSMVPLTNKQNESCSKGYHHRDPLSFITTHNELLLSVHTLQVKSCAD